MLNRSYDDKERLSGVMQKHKFSKCKCKIKTEYVGSPLSIKPGAQLHTNMLRSLTLQSFKSNELAMTGKIPVLHYTHSRKTLINTHYQTVRGPQSS